MKVEDRREQLLSKGIKLAVRSGYAAISRKQITDAAGVSEGLLSLHFGTMDDFRRALMQYAVDNRNLLVIAQGLVAGDLVAKKAPASLKQEALASITT